MQVSSYGLTAGTQPGTSDVTEAVATGKPASFEGLDPQTGERILSVSAPLRFNGRVIGVLRYVTALHEADRPAARRGDQQSPRDTETEMRRYMQELHRNRR